MRRRTVFLGMLLLSLCHSCGTGRHYVVTSFSTLAITENASGAPFENATLVVRTLAATGEDSSVSQPVYSSPTSVDGMTTIPLTFVSSDASPFRGNLQVTVSGASLTEVLVVPNGDGATIAGSAFAIRVVDSDSPSPSVMVPRAVIGTNPALIEVKAYTGTIVVCARETRSIIWQIAAVGEYSYLATVALGEVPPGFAALEVGLLSCDLPPLSVQPGRSAFTVVADLAGSSEPLLGTYCETDDGAVVDCGLE